MSAALSAPTHTAFWCFLLCHNTALVSLSSYFTFLHHSQMAEWIMTGFQYLPEPSGTRIGEQA